MQNPNNPELTFYGPHPCERGCGIEIVKVSKEQGGDEFELPEAPVYPNSVWPVHICPKDVEPEPLVPTEEV